MSLTESISLFEIKKIFSNRRNKQEYLTIFANQTGTILPNWASSAEIDNAIIESWNYEVSKNIIRDLFIHTDKYNHNRNCGERIGVLMNEWETMGLGSFDWPFMPQSFDQHVHALNRRDIDETQKDQIIANEAIKFRRIKDLNAIRNDYIEYLIFENNENVIPTFSNVRGVDFYINGNPFDQKVSKSVSKTFKDEHGANYRQVAIDHPELVAQCLYKYQDEERFGYEPRLFIVYLDSEISMNDIENSLQEVDFSHPIELEFEYAHSHGAPQMYQTKCYVVLVHK